MQYLLLHYGYAFLVLGLIIEGDATLIAAAILAGQQILSLNWVIALAMGVTIGGNELLFEIGAMGRMRRLMTPGQRERVQRWLHSSRSGFLTLLFSRFMWGFRLIIPLGAGLTRVRRRLFALTNVVGAVIWVLLLTYFGVGLQHWFASLHAEVVHYQPQIAVGLFLAGMAVGLGTIPWKLTRRALRRPHLGLLSIVDRTRAAKLTGGEAKLRNTAPAWARKPPAPLPHPRQNVR